MTMGKQLIFVAAAFSTIRIDSAAVRVPLADIIFRIEPKPKRADDETCTRKNFFGI